METGETDVTIQTLEKKILRYKGPIQNRFLKRLYDLLPPMPIRNRQMHQDYAKVAGILMEELEQDVTRSHRAAIERYLEAIVPFIVEYEKKEYPRQQVSPENMLGFLMEQNGMSQYDLADDLGGQSVVSDILNGKRKLSREHIERLSKRFHISPASFFAII
ncbi:MAG: hypothetical protein A3I06_05035 [Candidatus Lindowbacteria bacterium RIFCSPLOWO2_02_FULL_62_12]|nr:MAG: hypothetical protein A3I06_05035 [Candidatus Lindowbacteria bacterium RIFCSPLOWO2_02_FULL_62_12]